MQIKLATVPYEQAKADAVRKILNMSLAGLGTGAALRGVLGLKNLMNPPYQPPFVSPGPSTLPVPVVADDEEEDQLAKLASDAAANPGIVNTLATQLSKLIPDDAISRNVSNMAYAPWMMPLMFGGTAAGIYGGWRAADSLIGNQRKQQQEEALEAARADYERALQEQAQAGHKFASDAGPYDELNELYDAWLNKSATSGLVQGGIDLSGRALAAMLTLAGVSGVGSAIAAYKYGRRISKDKATNTALKQRAQRLWANQRQPLAVVPSLVPAA